VLKVNCMRTCDTDSAALVATPVMLTLRTVFAVHRFIAGSFGVLLLAFPTGVCVCVVCVCVVSVYLSY
jgi:hypothetical protein